MKTYLKILLAILTATILVGCGTPFATTTTVPIVTAATGTAPAVTNYVTVPVTNYAPNAYVTQGATYLTAAAPLIPAPWGTAATAVATLAAIIAGFVAQKQTTKANASAGASASLAAAIVAHPEATAISANAMKSAVTNSSTAATAVALQKAASPT